jgi:hypothetical protein
LINSLPDKLVNIFCWSQIPEQNIILKAGAIFMPDLIDIFLSEEQFIVVQTFQVGLQDLRRRVRVEFSVGVVTFL